MIRLLRRFDRRCLNSPAFDGQAGNKWSLWKERKQSFAWAAKVLAAGVILLVVVPGVRAERQEPGMDFADYGRRLEQAALLRFQPRVSLASTKIANKEANLTSSGEAACEHQAVALGATENRFPWKVSIVTTIFWIGERASANNPVPNNRSSWDRNWGSNYGGYDNPNAAARRNFIPLKFVPRQNPFYVALPYNDIAGGHTKPEARLVVPWFRETFVRDGQSVLKGRWVAIHHGNKTCYAQWEDCGPFRTDHWQYVFGNQRPLPNLNQGAGLDVSPAVRDYLGLQGKDVCDWKFVEFGEVPYGRWSQYGDNNTFVILRRQTNNRLADRAISRAEPAN